jgi:hypothetical protein
LDGDTALDTRDATQAGSRVEDARSTHSTGVEGVSPWHAMMEGRRRQERRREKEEATGAAEEQRKSETSTSESSDESELSLRAQPIH